MANEAGAGTQPGQGIHKDGELFVNEVRFHQDGNTTNVDGEGNACHHSNPEVKHAGKVAEVKGMAPGHMHGKRHGGAESAHHVHHSKHSSKPHHKSKY